MHTGPNLGFVTVVQENGGYIGGYLATNSWGRPLEFRLTTAVQPNRVQQILYGDTLRPFIYADLIGKTLVEKSTVSVALILTDAEAMLDLRLHLPTPAARIDVLNAEQSHEAESAGILIRKTPAGALVCHPRFPTDNSAIRTLLEQLDPKMDFTEPFTRIREALTEARKMGATSRAA